MKHFFLTLLSIVLALSVGTTAHAQTGQALVNQYLQSGGVFRIIGNRTANYVMQEYNGATRTAPLSATDYSQAWVLRKSGNGFYLQNAATGHYLKEKDYPTPQALTNDGTLFYIKYSANNTGNSTFVTISTKADFSDKSCLHDDAQHNVVKWYAGASQDNTPSDWTLQPATDLNEATIVGNLNQGYVTTPTANTYYYLVNKSYRDRVMTEAVGTSTVAGKAVQANNFAQVWQLVSKGGNDYALVNVLTGKRINNVGGLSQEYTTSTNGGTFTLAKFNDKWTATYTLADKGTTRGLHCSESQGYSVVGWHTNADATGWYFKTATVDPSALAAAQAEYQSLSTLQTNTAAYTTKLAKYFTDGSCSELKAPYSTMSAANLTTALTADGFPETIRQMVLKVRNNSWEVYKAGWDKTEKTFRVGTYKAYSYGGYDGWAKILKLDYRLGQLTNPTGISVKEYDVLQVYVGSIPTGQKVKLEIVGEGSATGTQIGLKEGYNVISSPAEGTVFVNYDVNNIINQNTFTPISTYAPVKVHIEGGTINGYFDLTRGDNDTDWANLQQYLLKGSSVLDLKTEQLIFHMNKDRVTSACPTEMTKLLTTWNTLIDWEREMMGLEEYKGYFNSMLTCTSIDRSYMFASNYGTYYNNGTLSTIMNANQMTTSGGALWGPAHENGHIHQKLINMIGQTEISTNLFSNIAVFRQGHNTSRATSTATTLKNMANGVFWNDRGLWERVHLYYQLYLFFHATGKDTSFYPNLFKAFRKGPELNQRAETFVPATEDYLRFYETVCKVSGYDMTEFFQAYGFFEIPTMQEYTLNGTTQKAYHVGDYSNYYITITQQMIDESKARVKAMHLTKNGGNAAFIEDRITAPLATYEGHQPGELKTAFSDEDENLIGKHGDVGQYTSFDQPCSAYEFTTSITDPRAVQAVGTGAVGFKVYDKDGNLVFMANTNKFTLPESLVGQPYTIKAAQGNGEDVLMTKGEDRSTITWNVVDNKNNVLHTFTTNDLQKGTTVMTYPADMQAYTKRFVNFIPATPSVVANGHTTVTVKYNFTGPFLPSTTTDLHYYHLKVRDGYINYTTKAPYLLTPAPSATNNSQWAFIGNPFEGFRILNAATGTQQSLTFGTTYNGGNPVMGTTEDRWEIIANQNDASGKSFSIKVKDKNCYFNKYANEGYLKYWQASANDDAGSNVTIEAASAAEEFNGYFRLKNSQTNKYIMLGADGNFSVTSNRPMMNPSNVFLLEQNTDGTIRMGHGNRYVANNTFKATDAQEQAYPILLLRSNANSYAIYAKDGHGLGNSYWQNSSASGASLSFQTGDAGGSKWKLEPATTLILPLIPFENAAYSTAYMPFAYTVDNGITANIISIAGSTAKTTAITTVPAGTGVLLISPSDEVTMATLNIVAPTPELTQTNVLTGTYTPQLADGSQYTFSAGPDQDRLGFYIYTAGAPLNPYRAYISATSAAGVRAFLLDPQTLTGITSATEDNKQKDIYDLQGRRLNKASRPGLYIVNGQKQLKR